MYKGESALNINKPLFKRLLTLSSILLIGVLLLTACNGAFSLQGNGGGGIDLPGGSSDQSGSGQGMNQTTLILIVVGVVVLILILLVRRK